jgi:hypothetical protein
MQMQHIRHRALACLAGLALALFSAGAAADPPSRVARLGYMSGPVSFSPAGESDWDEASLNRPLTNGDRVWSDAGGRAEIQFGGAMVRLDANTGVSVLNMDDTIAQLQLTQGVLNVRVRRLQANQVFEVDTPNLAFTLREPGAYRIEVDPDGNATTILVRRGQGEVYGDGTSYVIDAGQPYRFTDTDLRQQPFVEAPRADDFDRWAGDRDRAYDNSISARYVSADVVGLHDLDAHGSWRVDATYGNVWTPRRVSAGWAPYRDGHWAWVEPWGWTWVDDAPWGFAVSHYGRWANIGGSWGWVPGPVRAPAYYAPALVAFVGGANFQLTISSGNVGGVAWFPLAPREVYRPSYAVSRGYFERVNSSNTVINNTVIRNTYNTTNVTNVVYANRSVPGAVVAVPTTTFVQSQPVARSAVPVNRAMVVNAPVAQRLAVAPTEKSVRGGAAQGDKPPARVFDRVAVAHTAPPAARAGFVPQQPQPSRQAGKPREDVVGTELKRAPAAAAPQVKVVEQTQQSPPTRRPPAKTQGSASRSADARDSSDERRLPANPVVSTPPAATPPAAAPQALPPQAAAPVKAPPAQRSVDERAVPERQPNRKAPQAPPPQAEAPMAATPAAPTAQRPDEERVKSERLPKGEARGQPVAPAQSRAQSPAMPPQPAEPRAAAPTQAPPPQAAAPLTATPVAPTAQRPDEERVKSERQPKGEARGQPAAPPQSPTMPPQPAEPRAAAPTQAPPRQPPQPRMATPPAAAPQPVPPAAAAAPAVAPPRPSPVAQPQGQRSKPEPAAAARPPEAAMPATATPKPAPPREQAAPQASRQNQEPRPATGKQSEKAGRENKPDEPNGKQKG